jgi:curved DNA-binding protein CbpA
MGQSDREAPRQLNLYEVLQVSVKASPDVLQAAYRVLARTYHPDLNATPEAARMMRQLNAAYTVLSDPARRAKYDAQRAHVWRARAQEHRPVQPTPINAAARATPAVAGARGGRASLAPPVAMRTSWHPARLAAVLIFLLVMMGSMLFAFWLIAGALEDQPTLLPRAVADYGALYAELRVA